MKKILHVFEYFDQGGIENFVMNIYRNMDRNRYGFDFAFINRKEGCFDEEAKQLGGHIYYFDSEKKSFSNYYKSLSRIIKEHGPYDVVHSHMYYFSGIILGIARIRGVKCRIAHSHETFKGRKPTLVRKAYEAIMQVMIRINATQLLSCSDIAGKHVFGENANCKTLYNGIDVKRFVYSDELRQKIRTDLMINDKKVYLCVGRFADQKNHVFLLDVFKCISEKQKNAFLILIGNGALIGQVKEKIKALGIEDKVLILSNIKKTEEYYNASDLFVLPAKYEGMSIVSVEAQVTGLGCLLSDNVPFEIDTTPLVKHLSLDDGVEKWAETAIQMADMEAMRNNYYTTFVNGRFDVKQTVKDLCEIYEQQ